MAVVQLGGLLEICVSNLSAFIQDLCIYLKLKLLFPQLAYSI